MCACTKHVSRRKMGQAGKNRNSIDPPSQSLPDTLTLITTSNRVAWPVVGPPPPFWKLWTVPCVCVCVLVCMRVCEMGPPIIFGGEAPSPMCIKESICFHSHMCTMQCFYHSVIIWITRINTTRNTLNYARAFNICGGWSPQKKTSYTPRHNSFMATTHTV